MLILSHCYWWSLYQNLLAAFTSWVAYLREQLRQWWENNFLLSLFLLILQMVTRSYVVAVGNEIADLWLNSVRELSDNCSRLQGLLVFNAVGGVTGSCLGSMLFEHLSVNYVNKSKLGSTIYLSPRLLFQKKKKYITNYIEIGVFPKDWFGVLPFDLRYYCYRRLTTVFSCRIFYFNETKPQVRGDMHFYKG